MSDAAHAPLPIAPADAFDRLAALHAEVFAAATARLREGGGHAVRAQKAADTIFEIDADVDPVLIRFCEEWSREHSIVLIAEGVEADDGPSNLPEGVACFGCDDPASAKLALLVDPIDGTRGLMYGKRSAWFLAGLSANPRWPGKLSDVAFAFAGELPTPKAGWLDRYWATRGGGAKGQRLKIDNGRIDGSTSIATAQPLAIQPSTAADLRQGFASLSKFFPMGKDVLARVEHRLLESLGLIDGQAVVFDDQYISTGGQLVELLSGRDRFIADLRAWMYRHLSESPGLCCHPYDLAAVLIAQEAGVIITDAAGNPLDGPMDVTTPMDWVGYANKELAASVGAALRAAMLAAD